MTEQELRQAIYRAALEQLRAEQTVLKLRTAA